MGPTEPHRDAAAIWDIAVPSTPPPGGMAMAGFSAVDDVPVDLRVVPYPAVTVVFDLGRRSFVIDGAAGVRQRGSAVLGMAPTGVRARGRDIECLQVRLSPIVAHAVLGDAVGVGATPVSLADVWGRRAELLEEQLREARSWAQRFAIVESAVAGRYRAGRSIDPEVGQAWRRIVETSGQVRVEDVADDVGWTRKRLWSRFRSQIGLTPKRSAQLVRFDRAVHLLTTGRDAARVAAEGGYADQSHLHREVVAFAGVPPSAASRAPWLAVDDVAWAPR